MNSPAETLPLRNQDLPVEGMTRAACAARIEKKLNRMGGVTATVNYATGTAHVAYPAELDPAELVATVERTGYKAVLPAPPTPEAEGPDADSADAPLEEADPEAATLRQRLVVGTV